jgi:glycosyltransferase involved in cell wall biosynthesis
MAQSATVASSVALFAHNHERYIEQAIEGALMQRTRAPFEVVIGEDASTDRTREIAQDYARRYPEIVRVLAHDRNLGMHRNWVATMAACRGRYIAWLDADDYWTSSEKLQRQVDFLDAHPDYSMCFHDAALLYENGAIGAATYCRIGNAKPPATCTLEHLVVGNFVPTSSVMFRAGLIGEIPAWVYDLNWIDWPLHLMHAEHGKVGFIDEQMSVYRVHGGGLWSGLPRPTRLAETIEFYDRIYARLGASPRRVVDQRRAKACLELSRLQATNDEFGAAVKSLTRALRGYVAARQAPPLANLAITTAGVSRLGLRRSGDLARSTLRRGGGGQ